MVNENNNNQVVNIDAQSLQGMQQQNQQMSEQQKEQELQKIRQNTEAKTVVNGKEVPLKEALKAEELFNEQNTQTGINQAHDNSSEAVKAGGFAQNMQAMQGQEMQGQQSQTIKQSNVQSGQKEVEKHLEQARQQVQQEEQQAQQQKQQSGYNIQPKGNVNSKLEEKGQQFNQTSQLQPHEEASQQATKQAKGKGQKN